MALSLPPEGSSRVPVECLYCGKENAKSPKFWEVVTSEMAPHCHKCGRVSLTKVLRLLAS